MFIDCWNRYRVQLFFPPCSERQTGEEIKMDISDNLWSQLNPAINREQYRTVSKVNGPKKVFEGKLYNGPLVDIMITSVSESSGADHCEVARES